MSNNKRIKKIPTQYQSQVKINISNLIDFITTKREEKKLSQETVAEMLNITVKTYQAYEQGTRKPSMEVLILMFLVFNFELKPIKKS